MGVVNTTNTFASTDVVTSEKMNNIIDETTFTNDAIGNSTLAVVGGKLRVAAAGITSNELATNSVTPNAIMPGGITADKLSPSVVFVPDESVTNQKLANDSVTTIKIAEASISPTKLNGNQSGAAPIFAARAFVKLNPHPNGVRNTAFRTGTYSAAIGTVVTCSLVGHGLRVGDAARLVFTRTSGTGAVPTSATFFVVATVPDANTFTVIFTSAAISAGTFIAEFIQIQGGKNVSSAFFYNSTINRIMLNFTVPMDTVNYTTLAMSHHYPSAWIDAVGEDTLGETQLNTARTCFFYTSNNARFLNIVVFE